MSQQKPCTKVGVAICIALIWGFLSIPFSLMIRPRAQTKAEKSGADETESGSKTRQARRARKPSRSSTKASPPSRLKIYRLPSNTF